MDYRLITKYFACSECGQHFKKLVQSNSEETSCEKCGASNAIVIEPSEFNRESVDKTYRLSTIENPEVNEEFHLRTNILDRDPKNIYGDARTRKTSTSQEDSQVNPSPTGTTRNIPNSTNRTSTDTRSERSRRTSNESQSSREPRRAPVRQPSGTGIGFMNGLMFLPFNQIISPFAGSVNRHVNGFLFDDIFGDLFQIPNNDFFQDNFSSNFTSNFNNPMMRLVFIQSMNQNQPSGNPPASKAAIEKLKHFKMTGEYCKKDEKGNLEYPSCSVCLAEINKGDETILVPCGHMFHSPCLMKWLQLHNTCPVCRFELPTDDPIYEANRQSDRGRSANTNNINSNSSQSPFV